MWLAGSLLTILTGFAIMAYGLFFFYAFLPLLYGLIGFDIGLLLGGAVTGEAGAIAIILGIVGGVFLGAASYLLEPYRRILLGISGGALFGLSVAAAFGLDSRFGGIFGAMLAVACGVIGGLIVPLFFDLFVIGISAASGALMILTGAHHILPNIEIFDRAAGGMLPTLLTIVLAAAGGSWQYSNITKWIQKQGGQQSA